MITLRAGEHGRAASDKKPPRPGSIWTELPVLVPWIANHPPVGLWSGDPRCCPNCGGTDLERNGWNRTALTTYAAYRCQDCGANARNNFVKNRVEMRPAR